MSNRPARPAATKAGQRASARGKGKAKPKATTKTRQPAKAPSKGICSRHGAIVETGCLDCERALRKKGKAKTTAAKPPPTKQAERAAKTTVRRAVAKAYSRNTKKLTPALVAEILDGVLDGTTLREVCEAKGVDRSRFYRALYADKDLALRYDNTRDIRGDAHHDDAVWLVQDLMRRKTPPIEAELKQIGLAIRYKFRAAQNMSPRKFGGTATVHSNDPDNPLPPANPPYVLIPSKSPES